MTDLVTDRTIAVPMSGASSEKRIFVADTRRRWPLEEKLAMVAETRTIPVARVARKHGVTPGLLFRWRKTLGDRVATSRPRAPEGFVPVALPAPLAPLEVIGGHDRDATIEIILAGGRRIIVGKDVDAAALGRILDVLERRPVRRTPDYDPGEGR
jgi:transposase